MGRILGFIGQIFSWVWFLLPYVALFYLSYLLVTNYQRSSSQGLKGFKLFSHLSAGVWADVWGHLKSLIGLLMDFGMKINAQKQQSHIKDFEVEKK